MTSVWFSAPDEQWGSVKPQPGDKLEFVAVKKSGKEWGRVIVKVEKRYSEEPTGRSLLCTFVAASQKEARTWFTKELKARKTFLWHLCKSECTECEHKDKSVNYLWHVDTWRILSSSRAADKEKVWKGAYNLGEDTKSVSTADEGDGLKMETDEDTSVEVVSATAGSARKRAHSGSKSRPSSPKTRKRPADSSRESAAKIAEAVLDNELDLLDADAAPSAANAASSGAGGENQVSKMFERLNRLREQVQGRRPDGDAAKAEAFKAAKDDAQRALDEAVARQKGSQAVDADAGPEKVSAGPAKGAAHGAEILAKRAAEKASAGGAKVPGNNVEAAQKKFFSMFRRAMGMDPFDSQQSVDAEELEAESVDQEMRGAASRRMIFRRLAQQSPGSLTLKAINEYRGLMEAADCDLPVDEWSPIFLKYFLTVFLVHTKADTLSEPLYRELRTYVEAIDGLLRGNTLQVCDLLVQQFKATTMAVKDESWGAARWLQLIPHEVTRNSTISADDEFQARRMELQDLKARELKARLGRGGQAG